jgi:pyruvate,water dikinase
LSDEYDFVAFLDDIEPSDAERFGGKATNLAQLKRLGFPTPAGFAIPIGSFGDCLDCCMDIVEFLEQLSIEEDIDEVLELADEIKNSMQAYELPKDLQRDIEEAVEELGERIDVLEHGFAVRSSANVEDSASVSFAGQAESVLCVSGPEDVVDAVKRVWLSALTPRAIFYLKSKNVPLNCVKMGVVVQEMVQANVSGVMFTTDVVSNDFNQLLVDATWGLGEPLVSGRVTPDTYVLERTPLRVIDRRLGTKEMTSSIRVEDGKSCVKVEDTPQDLRSTYVLRVDELLRIAQMGLNIEERMGGPQDIEWCMRHGELVILQTRPITTIHVSS